VPDTYADSTELEKAVGFRPSPPVKVGVARFVGWYREQWLIFEPVALLQLVG